MSDPYFQKLFADRIGGANYGKSNAIYKFEKIKRAKRKALADHPNRQLLDFGIGENDEMAPEVVRRRMAEEINKPENRGYADNGIPAFREAAARFMQREFSVALDPPTEIVPCIGSKNALAMLPAVFINPGDVTLMTVPGYPIAGTHTAFYGGVVYKLPLTAENDFLPDLESIPADVRAKAKLLVLCYPNSPTGRTAPPEFYERAIAFAKKHEIVIIQDAAHGILSYDRAPNSFLAIPGARDVGVEVHSMSKAFDMIGWRIGWVCGNERIVGAYGNVKDNFDSGQFIAIQKAAIAGLDDPSIPQPHPHQVRTPPQKTRRHAPALRLPMQAARRHLLPLHAIAEEPSPTALQAAVPSTSKTPKPPASTSSPSNRSAQSPGTMPAHSSASARPTKHPDEAAEDALMAETESRLKNIQPVF